MRFKFFHGNVNIIEKEVERWGLEEVLEDYGAIVVEFPLSTIFKRNGAYWLNNHLYYCLKTGETIMIPQAHLPTGEFDYPCFSEKEFNTLKQLVELFGVESLTNGLKERFTWYNTFLMLNRTKQRARLKILKNK